MAKHYAKHFMNLHICRSKGEDYCAYSLSVGKGLTPTYRGKILKE
jgi:hypothetical protein